MILPYYILLIGLCLALLVLGGIFILAFFCAREYRKLLSETRKILSLYFPAYVNKEAGKESDNASPNCILVAIPMLP